MISNFYDCKSLEFIGFNNVNAPKLTSMDGMLRDCTFLKKIDFSR